MSKGISSDFVESLQFSDPVACYTKSNPVTRKEKITQYIQSLPYQNDPVTTIQLSWVLRQMPDEHKRHPYLGVPLAKLTNAVEEFGLLADSSCKVVLGFGLNEEVLLTERDVPTTDGELEPEEFSELIASAQSSADRVFTDMDVFAIQYSDHRRLETNQTVVYADHPDNYDYFLAFDDEYAFDGITGGAVFSELDAVQFTETVAGLLHLKSQLRIDAYQTQGIDLAYEHRFITPLVTAFDASLSKYNVDLDGTGGE